MTQLHVRKTHVHVWRIARAWRYDREYPSVQAAYDDVFGAVT